MTYLHPHGRYPRPAGSGGHPNVVMPRHAISSTDLDDVRRIVARCLGQVASIDHLPSQQNIVCRVRLADGRRRILKMARRPGDNRRSGTSGSVVREPGVYKLLRDAALPAPRVHCGEGERGQIGRAWFVCDDMGRRTASDTSGLSHANRRSLYEQLGRFLARVHDLRASGGDEAISAGGVAPSPVQSWHGRQIDRALDTRLFRGEAAERLGDLLRFEPPQLAVGSLCHGDYHPAQIIRRGPRLVAAIDWESAHAGDPGYDHAAFEVMLRVTTPIDLADAALQGYAAARPFFDRVAYRDVRTAHAVSLSLAFTDARRPAFARAAKQYAEQRLVSTSVAA